MVAQLALFAALAAALFTWGDGWGPVAMLAGTALAGIGLALAGAGMITLGPNLSPLPAPRADAVLVERGVYRVVRHPIYGGLVLAGSGVGIADGNWAVLGLAGLLAAVLGGKSAGEERRLEAHLPGYAGYRSRVRWRIIPWVV